MSTVELTATDERMKQSARWIMGPGRLVHEPSRLAIPTILRPHGADHRCIQRLTGPSKSNLSKKLSELEKDELVDVSKHFEGKNPATTVALTRKGKATIEDYWYWMKRIAMEGGDRD